MITNETNDKKEIIAASPHRRVRDDVESITGAESTGRNARRSDSFIESDTTALPDPSTMKQSSVYHRAPSSPTTPLAVPPPGISWNPRNRRRLTSICFILALVAATFHRAFVTTPLPSLITNIRKTTTESRDLGRTKGSPAKVGDPLMDSSRSNHSDSNGTNQSSIPLMNHSNAPNKVIIEKSAGPEEVTTNESVPVQIVATKTPTESPTATPVQVETIDSPLVKFVTTDWTETHLHSEPDYSHYEAMEDFLTGPGLTTETLTQAVCEFRPIQYSDHFPHVMQQLYRCFSWWIAHPDVPAVLLLPGTNISWAQGTTFIKGFIGLMQSSLNLTVFEGCDKDNVDCGQKVQSKDSGKWEHDTEVTDFALLDTDHQLRSFGLQHIANRTLHPASLNVDNWRSSGYCPDDDEAVFVPRISILDRPDWSSRHLKNGPAIKAMIESRFARQNVPIVPFSYYTSFEEQATLFLDTDILISPHGAQLTGMAFLPECASILEIFPYRYQAAEYFGSLAASLNLHHGFVYIGDPDESIPYEDRFHFIRQENSRKDDSVEPDLTKINDALDSMVDHWKKCVCSKTNADRITAEILSLPTTDYTETDLRHASDYAPYNELVDFLEGPGVELDDDKLTEAICEFRPVMYSHHFPHTMQQFYRCFSWWLAHRNIPAVLVTGNNTDWGADTSFIKGFIDLLRLAMDLTVTDVYDGSDKDTAANQAVQSKNTGKWEWDTEITDYAILDPGHQLHQYAVEFLEDKWNYQPPTVDWSQSDVCQADAKAQSKKGFLPRITVLDRPDWSTRHLKNGGAVKDAIEAIYTNLTVPIVTFTYYTTFEEQAALFRTADILISPHGAQLTGLAFLPRCASIIEICPYRYLVPEYFGSLANSLRLNHGFVYIGNSDEIPYAERYHFMRDGNNTKDWPLAPNVSKITDALEGLIAKWRTCVCSTGTTGS